MLGRIMPFEPFGEVARLGRRKRLVERGGLVGGVTRMLLQTCADVKNFPQQNDKVAAQQTGNVGNLNRKRPSQPV